MSKLRKIKVDISEDEQIFGSSTYSITVNITNISSKDISNLDIEPTLVLGKKLNYNYNIQELELSELEIKKKKLIKEMEWQIDKAYEKNRYSKKKLFDVSTDILSALLDNAFTQYINLFNIKKIIMSTPDYVNEAFRIDEFEDVEILERDFISTLKEESLIKKGFLINKIKLEKTLQKIESKNTENAKIDTGINLAASETISFPFKFRAPNLIRRKISEIQFKITYKDPDTDTIIYSSSGKKVTFSPSTFAVPTGCMLGSICGYFIKLILILSKTLEQINYNTLIGSILLGLVVGLLTSKNNEKNKMITVEDFTGGFIIGALVGIFSDNFIEKLKLFIK